jgi:hypothetical protein
MGSPNMRSHEAKGKPGPKPERVVIPPDKLPDVLRRALNPASVPKPAPKPERPKS